MDTFEIGNIYELDSFNIANITNEEICRIILNIILALNSYTLGVLIYKLRNKTDTNLSIPSIIFSKNNRDHIYLLLIIGYGMKFYFSYLMINEIMNKGYLAFYIGEIEINKNIIQAFIENFAIIGLFLYLSSNDIKKWFAILLIIIYALLSMSTGQRGLGMIFLVLALFYLLKRNLIKINFVSTLILFISLIFISQFIGSFRIGDKFSGNSFVKSFFWEQGVSIAVIKVAISKFDKFQYNILDLFGNVTGIFDYYYQKIIGSGNTFDRTKIAVDQKIFSGYVSYIADKNIYLNGGGIGGCYIAQFYIIAKEFSQIIGGVIVGYFLNVLYKLFTSSKITTRFLGFIFLLSFIYIPRDNLTDFLTDNWILILSFLLLNYIFKFNVNAIFKKTGS
jgi:hypothetical protein